MSAWQTIDTAPKDGTAILVVLGNNIHCSRFNAEAKQWRIGVHAVSDKVIFLSAWFAYEPTHWMPLPDPPEASK